MCFETVSKREDTGECVYSIPEGIVWFRWSGFHKQLTSNILSTHIHRDFLGNINPYVSNFFIFINVFAKYAENTVSTWLLGDENYDL